MPYIVIRNSRDIGIVIGPNQATTIYEVQKVEDENAEHPVWKIVKDDGLSNPVSVSEHAHLKSARKTLDYIMTSFKRQNGLRIPTGLAYGIAGLIFGMAIAIGVARVNGPHLPQNYKGQMDMINMTTPSDGDLNLNMMGKMAAGLPSEWDGKTLGARNSPPVQAQSPLKSGETVDVAKPVSLPDTPDTTQTVAAQAASASNPSSGGPNVQDTESKLEALKGIEPIIPGSDFGSVDNLAKVMPDMSSTGKKDANKK